jgi:hypothetical protein
MSALVRARTSLASIAPAMQDVKQQAQMTTMPLFRGQGLDQSNSVASHDVDLPRAATAVGNRHRLGAAARYIRPIGRRDRRWIPMGPIPGNVIWFAVADTAGYRRRQLFAVRSVISTIISRPADCGLRSPTMPGKMGAGPMCRGKCSARGSRSGKRLAGRQYKCKGVDGHNQRRIYF